MASNHTTAQPNDGGAPMLQLEGVSTFYGPIQALDDVSLVVNRGEIVTLIGSNGAGKTTLLMTVCGNPTTAAEPDSDIARRYRTIALRTTAHLAARQKSETQAFPKIVVER